MSSSPSGHLAIHCSRCGFTPEFGRAEVLASFKGKVAREIVEAYHSRRGRSECVSAPLLALPDDEFVFLEARGVYLVCGLLSFAERPLIGGRERVVHLLAV